MQLRENDKVVLIDKADLVGKVSKKISKRDYEITWRDESGDYFTTLENIDDLLLVGKASEEDDGVFDTLKIQYASVCSVMELMGYVAPVSPELFGGYFCFVDPKVNDNKMTFRRAVEYHNKHANANPLTKSAKIVDKVKLQWNKKHKKFIVQSNIVKFV